MARALAEEPPGSLAELARVYGKLLNNVEAIWQESSRRAALNHSEPAPLPDPRSRSCARFSTVRRPRPTCRWLRLETWPSARSTLPGQAARASHCGSRLAGQGSRRASPGHQPGRFPDPGRASRVPAGKPQQPWRAGPAQAASSPVKPESRTISARIGEARAGAGPREPEESADSASAGEPGLGTPFRLAPGCDTKRLRNTERAADPSRAARPPGQHVHGRWLVAEVAPSPDHAFQYLSAVECRSLRCSFGGRRELALLANESTSPRPRIHSRCPSVRGRSARPAIGGPSFAGLADPNARRRTLYAFIDRLGLPGLYRTFDFPDPNTTSPRRDQTTVPPQSLFMMNHPFVPPPLPLWRTARTSRH